MKLKWIGLVLAIGIFSCTVGEKTEEQNLDNPHHSAMPDSDVVVETELSETDKNRIASAKGKEASPVTMTSFNAILENLEVNTGICYFWSTTNSKTESSLKTLDKILDQLDSEQFKIFLINIDSIRNVKDVNALVRGVGIDAEILLLDNKDGINEITGNNKEWNEQFPSYYIYKPEDESGTWLDGQKEEGELYVMLQTFVM